MKQVLQSLSDGRTYLEELPSPQARAGELLIRTASSVVSAGTERMLLEFGKANFLEKARQQPDRVRQVLDKVRTDGLMPTVRAVRAKLDQPIPLGYSNVGRVVKIGSEVHGFSIGDRVVSNGHHAEFVCVPANLCARVPHQVADEDAAFAVIGAIALQGIRLVEPTLGERVVVMGLGLIGLLAVQLLRANGCQVLGIDPDPTRAGLARGFGARACNLDAGADPLEAAHQFSDGKGVDAVVIAASTRSSEPVHQAALMCRKRGRIVLVGVTGLELSRADFYEKELSFQVSCSYGPGRYDPKYEQKGLDYPLGLVRWTEQRNFEAVLDQMAQGRLNVQPLISHRFEFERAEEAYRVLGGEPSLGMVLRYTQTGTPEEVAPRTVGLRTTSAHTSRSPVPAVGVIGAGNYAGQVLIPALQKTGAGLRMVASAGGLSGVQVGRKFGFELSTTRADEIVESSEIDAVVIATRHESHAAYAATALASGKHVFVEKPLAISRSQVADIRAAYQAAHASGTGPLLMVGFNRRFAPQIVRIKSLLAARGEPAAFIMTVNAGAVPADHWTQDPAIGGGRVLGEACHFVDLLRFLAGTRISTVHATMMGAAAGMDVRDDKTILTLEFEGGSIGTIHYLANGHRTFPKERLEVFCGGSVLQLDNYRKLYGYGWPGFSRMHLRQQDKGNVACIATFIEAIRGGSPSPIPFDEIVEVTEATLSASEQLAGQSGI